jgi:hypothetical protein
MATSVVVVPLLPDGLTAGGGHGRPKIPGMGHNRCMRGDRPGPAGGGRDPLDDLRERLARLPAGHPSSPDYRPPQQRGEDGDLARVPGDLAGDSHSAEDSSLGGDSDGAEEGSRGDGDLGRDDLGRDDEAAGEGVAGQGDKPDGPHRRGSARPEGPSSGRHGQPTPRVPGPGLSQAGQPYRPWFSSGDGLDLWFSPDSGDRSG